MQKRGYYSFSNNILNQTLAVQIEVLQRQRTQGPADNPIDSKVCIVFSFLENEKGIPWYLILLFVPLQ